jgi:hypothetical protein
MKSSKFQAPTSREHPIFKSQSGLESGRGFGRLKFGASLVLGCWCLVLFCTANANAQYSIDWFTIDGGGGTSSNGQYTVTGTIGQSDASGPLTNGQYSVTGGFWALPQLVQAVGSPTLTIAPATPGNATISWSPNTPGFVLQETLSLTSTWTNSVSGPTNPATVPLSGSRKFYRLFKP